MSNKHQQEPASKQSSAPKKIKPTIPDGELRVFLEDKITLSKSVRIKQTDCGFLWRDGITERYRISVWVEDRSDEVYPSNGIAYSAFVHYNRETKVITDVTIKENEKKRWN